MDDEDVDACFRRFFSGGKCPTSLKREKAVRSTAGAARFSVGIDAAFDTVDTFDTLRRSTEGDSEGIRGSAAVGVGVDDVVEPDAPLVSASL